MGFFNFKATSKRDVVIQLCLIIGIIIISVLLFFYVLMPNTTHHGETVTVPNVQGMTLDELKEFLNKRNLKYEVNPDSGYSGDYPALAVLKQYPKVGAKVKEGRKIYVSLNASNPPKVKMPELIGGSLKNAQLILQSFGLELGKIRYRKDFAQNSVLEQWYNGNQISEGTLVPKGSKIDLTVGDKGLTNDSIVISNKSTP